MLAELMLGLELWVGLIGRAGHVPPSAVVPLVVILSVVVILSLFLGPRRGIVGWLTSRAGFGILLLTSILLVTAMNLPRAVGIAAILAINVGVVWYLLLLRQRRG
jgi:hypothetical protein